MNGVKGPLKNEALFEQKATLVKGFLNHFRMFKVRF